MALLDLTAVNVAVPSIQSSLATDVRGLSWVIDGYTLTFASLLLLAGGLGDRLGAKRVFVTGLAVFTLASVLCGLAPGLSTLVLSRILQGVGAALFMPSSLALLRQAYPDARERAHAIGTWSALTAISGLTRRFSQMVVARLGVGVGEATCSPASTSLIGDYFPTTQRARAVAIWKISPPMPGRTAADRMACTRSSTYRKSRV